MHYVELKLRAPKSLKLNSSIPYCALLIGRDNLDEILPNNIKNELKELIKKMRVNLVGYYIVCEIYDANKWVLLSKCDFERYFRQSKSFA